MWHNGRRVIVQGWALAKQQFASLMAERDQLKAELEWVTRDRNELRERLTDLIAATRARRQAQAELAGLLREREFERAQQAERDPARLLH
jgi:hypothetical protein